MADDGSGLRDTVFRQKLGDQYIADAFRIAHQADPQALLFYNDYGGEGLTQKSNRIYDLVQRTARAGSADRRRRAADARHGGESSDAKRASRPTCAGWRASACCVNISEMDVRIRDLPAPTKLDTQKSVYHTIVGVVRRRAALRRRDVLGIHRCALLD